MHYLLPQRRRVLAAVGGIVALVIAVAVTLTLVNVYGHAAATQTFYRQANLVSDIPGTAAVTDAGLVNAWGLSRGPTTPWWVSDNGTGLATLYTGAGAQFPASSPLVVTIPAPASNQAGATAAPSGNIFNDTQSFVITDAATAKSGPALFLFATEDGTISGWSPTVNAQRAILAVDNSTGAVYKGLALGSVGSSTYLYAANFRTGTIDVFDATFAPAHLSGAFTDTSIPAGFAPFNIANIGGRLYVAYAKQNGAKHDDVAGPGNGYLDVFTTSGQLTKRLVSQGPLDSPWGLALAPSGFGHFSGDLLVGNFGDGRINAFDPQTGAFRGALQSGKGQAVVIPGLWGLAFGNGGNAGPTTTLFFTAGIDHEAHGLFGSLVLMSNGSSANPYGGGGQPTGGY
jgi:uncharacterized protein (TIGR03118 family)